MNAIPSPARPPSLRGPRFTWMASIAFGLAYGAGAEASLHMAFLSGNFVTLWLPAGLYFAALAMTAPSMWPSLIASCTIVNFAFDLFHGTPFAETAAYAGQGTVQALLGAWLFRRFVTPNPRGDIMREFLGICICSAICSAGPVAACQAGFLIGAGSTQSFLSLWGILWTGNGMAILAVAPFVIVWLTPAESSRRWWARPARLAELAVLLLGLAIVLNLIMRHGGIEGPYKFSLLPFVLWAALRFGIRGASAVNLLVLVLIVYLATHTPGTPPQASIAVLYGFLAVCTVVGLVPAIAVEERMLLVDRLGNSEERFRTLAAAAREGIVISEAGVVLDANDQVLKLIGRPRDEVIGLPLATLLKPEIPQEAIDSIREGRDISFEHNLVQGDGTVVHAEIRARMMRVGERNIRMTTIRDVSERRKAEALLNGQYQVLEMIAASRPLAEVLVALARVIESQSEHLVATILVRDGDVLRYAAAPSLPPDVVRAIGDVAIADGEGSCGAAAFTRQPVFVPEIADDPRFARYVPLVQGIGLHASWSVPILDGKQGVLGTFSILSNRPGLPRPEQRKLFDIGVHMAAVAIGRSQDEAALKLSDFSVNQASMPTLWVSQAATIVRVNKATCELLGYTEGELLGMPINMLHPNINMENWAADWLEVRGLKRMNFESVQRRKDGRLIRVEVNLNWFEFEGKEYHFVFFQDVAERQQLEEELRQSQKMDAIGQLSGGIAHDFNNLLTVIQGNLGMMRFSGPLSRETSDSVDELEGAVNRASRLTGQLLAFGRKQVMRSQELDLNAAVETFSHLIRRVIGEAVEVQLEHCAGSLGVRADGSMLDQVMLNLCLNARDAMPRGGRLVLSTSAVSIDAPEAERMPAAREGRFARLVVADSGVGISAGNLARVFEPFFTTKEVGKGTGLGLASVYGILQQHGGWITVQSEVGRGATFGIYIPLVETGVSGRAPGQDSVLLTEGGETILLVDDNASVRTVANKALTLMGYRVFMAESGAEAYSIWDRHGAEIDLLLTDMMMPGELGGLEIARNLRAMDPELRVVFMSGYSADISREDFDESAGEFFLGKPFELTDLASTLKRSLASRA
jgi:PAS domain S-box-containing protein